MTKRKTNNTQTRQVNKVLQVALTPLALFFIAITGLVFIIYKITKIKHLVSIFIVFDQVASAIWYGTEDLTVSSNMGSHIKNDTANKYEKTICWVLRKFDNHHCIKNIGN